MPFVSIRLVKQVIEHDADAIKARINKDVTHAISDAAGIPAENVWLVFEEIEETDWFSGGARVKELREQS